MTFDWKSTIATVAPTLATALGGPLAGTAATAISKAVFGADSTASSASSDELAAAVTAATPETLAKLKAAEMQFKQDLKALDIDLERVASADRASARQRQVQLKDWVPSMLAALVLLGFFGAFAAMLFYPLPDGSKESLYILLGALASMATSVMTYYFGSSAGSAEKTRLLSDRGRSQQ